MSDLNILGLQGRLVRDATMKESANGIKICEFSIAANYSYRNESGEFEERADFFPLAIFGTYAEKMLPHLKKGQRVIIEGGIHQNRWTTAEGKNRSATVIQVKRLHLIFDKKTSDEVFEPNQESSGENFDFTEEQLADMYTESTEAQAGDALF